MPQNATPQIANYPTIAIRLIRDSKAINHKAFQKTPSRSLKTKTQKPKTENKNPRTQALVLIGNILIKGNKATQPATSRNPRRTPWQYTIKVTNAYEALIKTRDDGISGKAIARFY
ncbi:hypothetical protein [Pseudomonas coronafaciens]|uniref:hypothetical protein n=1 Tax=Pseudomonas coronafaciens TaxID=53409 RepID=UPI0011C374DD|nr:hypothetical protein [Pseudomonas coronafaciens]